MDYATVIYLANLHVKSTLSYIFVIIFQNCQNVLIYGVEFIRSEQQDELRQGGHDPEHQAAADHRHSAPQHQGCQGYTLKMYYMNSLHCTVLSYA